MTRFPLLALLAALALCAAEVHAASGDAPAPAAQTFTTPTRGSTTTLTLYLVLMVVLLGGGAYLVRNGFTVLQPKMKGARKLQISETRMLGNRQFLVVAEYEDRKMLLGVCPGRIDYLVTLSGAEPEFPAIEPEKSDARE